MMDLGRRMASWLSVAKRAVLAAAVLLCAATAVAQDADALTRIADEAAAKGLPTAPLTNKIREGLAKGVDPKRIEQVVRQMSAHLETADRLVRELDPAAANRDAPVVLMAESFGSGVTVEQVRELRRLSQPASGGNRVSADAVATAAKGLSLIEEVRLPVPESTAVMAEAVKQGFKSTEILDLAREIRRHETDYRAGRASLAALRDAIARGGRPEQLFRDRQGAAGDRPAATDRPQTPVERPAARPERPVRPEQPTSPERPSR
jgi:hypothetical protein